MDVVEKQIVHEYDEDRKEYASKGVAGTGLGLGIAGTALAFGLLANQTCLEMQAVPLQVL